MQVLFACISRHIKCEISIWFPIWFKVNALHTFDNIMIVLRLELHLQLHYYTLCSVFLMLHPPFLSNPPITQTASVGLFFPKCDSDQCLLPHWSLHRASHEDSLYEVRAGLFRRSCHWHAVLHCHPAAPARGLTSIHTFFCPHWFIFTFCFFCTWNQKHK